jgi:hypothetical protein
MAIRIPLDVVPATSRVAACPCQLCGLVTGPWPGKMEENGKNNDQGYPDISGQPMSVLRTIKDTGIGFFFYVFTKQHPVNPKVYRRYDRPESEYVNRPPMLPGKRGEVGPVTHVQRKERRDSGNRSENRIVTVSLD